MGNLCDKSSVLFLSGGDHTDTRCLSAVFMRHPLMGWLRLSPIVLQIASCLVPALINACVFPGKMYACQYCDAVFAQSIELSRHVRTHTGDKPYVCRDCGKGFRQANGLSIHLHTFHSMY